MKQIKTFLFAGVLLCGLCAVVVACNEPKDSEQQGEDVPFTVYLPGDGISGEEIPDILINPSFYCTELNTSKVIIANNDEELKKCLWEDYPSGYPYPYPSIDFSTKTLLLVIGKGSGGVAECKVGSFQYFPSGRYKFEVELAMSPLAVYGADWCVPVITDKIGDNAKIEVKLTEVNLKTDIYEGKN